MGNVIQGSEGTKTQNVEVIVRQNGINAAGQLFNFLVSNSVLRIDS